MNYLQYTSKEMYSSTELIRKSKMIFEKLNKQEIEKAIILRDGKPSFMLLDFATYEEIMTEYMALKNEFNKPKKKKEIKEEKVKTKEVKKDKEIADAELEKALKDIDNINFDDYSDNETAIINEVVIEERPIGEDEEKPLKEFWD